MAWRTVGHPFPSGCISETGAECDLRAATRRWHGAGAASGIDVRHRSLSFETMAHLACLVLCRPSFPVAPPDSTTLAMFVAPVFDLSQSMLRRVNHAELFFGNCELADLLPWNDAASLAGAPSRRFITLAIFSAATPHLPRSLI